MTITPTPQLHEIQLPEHEQKWLDSLNLSHATNVDRKKAFELLNSDKIGIPYKLGAVRRAFDSGAIPTARVSAHALASAYDVVRWALVRKHIGRPNGQTRASA